MIDLGMLLREDGFCLLRRAKSSGVHGRLDSRLDLHKEWRVVPFHLSGQRARTFSAPGRVPRQQS